MPALAVHCAGTSASVPIAADAAPSEVVMDVLADDPPKLEPSTFYQIPLLDVTKKRKKEVITSLLLHLLVGASGDAG
jgi:hypothetical protein